MSRRLSVATLLFFTLPPAGAQQPDPAWQHLSNLPEGSALHVHLRTGEVWKAGLVRWTPERLTVRRSGAEFSANRSDVARISKRSRARGALIGVLVGFAAAAPVGAFAGPYLADFGNPPVATRLRHAAGWGAFFGGVGAGIGALIGTQVTLYRSPGR